MERVERPERDVIASMPVGRRPAKVAHTTTSCGPLLDPKKMPAGEEPLRARECDRWALSHPDLDACTTGPPTP